MDKETAPIVRDIFRWKLEGMSFTAITRKLNELKIPSPSRYRYIKGIVTSERLGKSIWQVMTVKNMLQHPAYLGHMVQGQKKSGLHVGIHQTKVPKDKWVIVENTHEAIIEKEVFDEVQRLIAEKTEAYNQNKGKYAHLGNQDNILKGLVYCGKCGRNFVRYKNVICNGTKVFYTFICPNHAVNLEHGCMMKECIHEEILMDTILKVVVNELSIAYRAVELVKRLNKSKKMKMRLSDIGTESKRIKKELERVTSLKNSLYESYKDGILDEQEYEYAKNKYTHDAANMREKLGELNVWQQKFNNSYAEDNKWVCLFQGFKNEPVLTKALLNELIQKIIVHSETYIEVNFNYEDAKLELLSHLAENLAEKEELL